jgi:hypothetical protein
MSRSVPFFLVFLCLCLTDALSQFRVGASSAVITPSNGAFVAGHSQNRKFTGVNDDLYVKAVAISEGRQSVVIVTFDCIGLLYPQLKEIRRIADRKILWPRFKGSRVVMSSTHTHSGPDVVGIWGPDMAHTGVDAAYLDDLERLAADQVRKAWRRRKKAKAVYSVSEHGTEWVHNISEPGELDRTLSTLAFRRGKGKTLATLTNFACHPTILDGVNEKVSADYVGGFYKRMNDSLGGVNLFLQGAIGGWVQPEYEEKTFARAHFRGSALADSVMEGLLTAKPLRKPGIDFESKVFTLPVDNIGFRQLSAAGVIGRKISDVVETEVSVFSIGEAMFATHPGESFPAMSLATRDLLKTDGPKFIMGLGNDAIGYILKPEYFEPQNKIPHSKYLSGMSAGQGTAAAVMRALEEICRLMQAP